MKNKNCQLCAIFYVQLDSKIVLWNVTRTGLRENRLLPTITSDHELANFVNVPGSLADRTLALSIFQASQNINKIG